MPGVWMIQPQISVPKRSMIGLGGQQSALCVGGIIIASAVAGVEEFNGVSRSAKTDCSSIISNGGGCGVVSAGLVFGGYATQQVKKTRLFNGTSWSVGGDMASVNDYLSGCGTQTAGLVAGGRTVSNAVQSYDGVTWTTLNSLIAGRYGLYGCGTVTASVNFGGAISSPAVNNCEKFDGSVWSSGNPLNVAKTYLSGAGGQSSCNAFVSLSTEEYDGNIWVGGGTPLRERRLGGSSGNQFSSLYFGGFSGNNKDYVESYTRNPGNFFNMFG